MTNIQLLLDLYAYSKANNSQGVLDTSKTLSLCGVSNTIQNRVLLLTSSYTVVEDIVSTVKEIYRESNFLLVGSPALKIQIPNL